MKPFKIILWLCIGLVASVVLGAWGTYDYGLRCTKCLAKKHVVEHQFLGIPVSRRTKDQKEAEDYEGVFGHPCEHVLRKGGFGRTRYSLFGGGIACGITGEGSFFRPRMQAASAAYEVQGRLDDRALALETFQFIDGLMPPDLRFEQRKELPLAASVTLSYLAGYLEDSQTVEQWREALHTARKDFTEISNLPVR
jgi:hypothetical protein